MRHLRHERGTALAFSLKFVKLYNDSSRPSRGQVLSFPSPILLFSLRRSLHSELPCVLDPGAGAMEDTSPDSAYTRRRPCVAHAHARDESPDMESTVSVLAYDRTATFTRILPVAECPLYRKLRKGSRRRGAIHPFSTLGCLEAFAPHPVLIRCLVEESRQRVLVVAVWLFLAVHRGLIQLCVWHLVVVAVPCPLRGQAVKL